MMMDVDNKNWDSSSESLGSGFEGINNVFVAVLTIVY